MLLALSKCRLCARERIADFCEFLIDRAQLVLKFPNIPLLLLLKNARFHVVVEQVDESIDSDRRVLPGRQMIGRQRGLDQLRPKGFRACIVAAMCRPQTKTSAERILATILLFTVSLPKSRPGTQWPISASNS